MNSSQRCEGQVFHHYHFRPCPNKGKVDRDGKWFCGTHDPVAIKSKEEARDAKRHAQRDADNARYEAAKLVRQRADLCVAACEGISDDDVKRLTSINRCDITDFIAQNMTL